MSWLMMATITSRPGQNGAGTVLKVGWRDSVISTPRQNRLSNVRRLPWIAT